MTTPHERESEQIRQSLDRLAPKGMTVYEHFDRGWYFDAYGESNGPFDSAEEALEAAHELDNYSGPTESESYDGRFEMERDRGIREKAGR